MCVKLSYSICAKCSGLLQFDSPLELLILSTILDYECKLCIVQR